MTLIEVIVTIAISSILLFSLFSFFAFGNNTNNKSNSQYQVQSDVRLVSDYIQRQVRYATNVEIISNDTFENETSSGAIEEYDYIYFETNNTEKRMVHDRFKDGERTTIRLEGKTLASLYFTKNNENNLTITARGVKSSPADSIYDLSGTIVLPNIYIDYSDAIDDSDISDITEGAITTVLKFTNSTLQLITDYLH